MADERPSFGAEATAPAADDAAAPAAGKAKEKNSVSTWSKSKLLTVLRMVNLLNGVLLIATGILVFVTGAVSVSFSTVTVSGYVVFFGLMMMCLECNVGNMAPKFRRNFGFMFSFIGRSIFILFCATMLFATAVWLGYLSGALTALNGFFNAYVICVHPAFKTGELTASGDPFGGYTGGEAEMLNFLKRNPALANKAAGAAVSFARENPHVAMQVAAAASQPQNASIPGDESNPWGR